jgi:hypothetical protein
MAWLFQGTEAELLALAERDFIEVWSALFGEPPAAMIDRAAMIELMRAAFGPSTSELPDADLLSPGLAAAFAKGEP